MAQENGVRAVDRALDILNCFTMGKSNFSLMEIARIIELSPSTTLRLLTTLEKAGYLHRDLDNLRYYLGFRLAQISNIAFDNLDFCRIARPYLRQLSERFGESVGLFIYQEGRRVCVERVEGTRKLRSILHIGERAPLTRGASGRLILAHREEEEIRRILQEDPFCTLEDLKQIRQQGYAVSHGEREKGVMSVAAPLYNSRNEFVAALFLSGADGSINEQDINTVIDAICQNAKIISGMLGANS